MRWFRAGRSVPTLPSKFSSSLTRFAQCSTFKFVDFCLISNFIWLMGFELLVYDGSFGNPSEEQSEHQGKLCQFLLRFLLLFFRFLLLVLYKGELI